MIHYNSLYYNNLLNFRHLLSTVKGKLFFFVRACQAEADKWLPTDMTGAVTTKYENQHPVKLQTSSFSYKFTCSGTKEKI